MIDFIDTTSPTSEHIVKDGSAVDRDGYVHLVIGIGGSDVSTVSSTVNITDSGVAVDIYDYLPRLHCSARRFIVCVVSSTEDVGNLRCPENLYPDTLYAIPIGSRIVSVGKRSAGNVLYLCIS